MFWRDRNAGNQRLPGGTVPPVTAPTAHAVDASSFRDEAHAELVAMFSQRSGSIGPEFLADHLLQLYPQEEWPLLRDAGRALLRRFDKAAADALVVASRPKGAWRGRYTTGRRRGPARPYRTQVLSLSPLRIACNCPDYLSGSLGVCKHGLTVLASIASKKRTLRKALEWTGAPARVWWEPARPVEGRGDWLEGVRYAEASDAHRAPRTEAGRERVLQDLDALTKRRRKHEDPALRARVHRELQQVQRIQALALSKRERARALRGFRLTPYGYQHEAIEKFLSTGRMLLADDMGLGKTVQASAIGHVLVGANKISRILVLAPASLKSQWVREWTRATDVPVQPVEGAPEARAALYRDTKSGALVANYEQVFRDLELMQAWAPQLVILDEAQRIKNWATRTARNVKQIDAPYRLVLTGTPMENRIEELASIMDWVDPDALAPKWRLPAVHGVSADGGREIVGVRRLDTLRARLQPSMLRRRRSEVLTDLPSRTDTVCPVVLTPQQAEVHDDLNLPIAQLLAIARRRGLSQPQFLRLMSLLNTQRIVSNGFGQYAFDEVWPSLEGQPCSERRLASLGMPKLERLHELIEGLVIDQRRRVVVFSQWRRALQLARWRIEPLLRAAGLRVAMFTGAESQKRRTHNIVDFHDDPACRVLLCTDAGGVGLNLQRAANSCINFEMPWNPAVLEQRIARIHRLGQPDPIDVFNLVSEGSIEARIAMTVANKKAMFTGLFDGTTDEVLFDTGGGFLAAVSALVDVPSGESGTVDDDESGTSPEEDFEDHPLEQPPVSATPRAEPPGPGADEVRSMFEQLRVETRDDGGIRLEAPPEAAKTLSALFSGMAALLDDAARAGATDR